MTAPPVGHAPTPAQETADPAIPENETCEEIKARYGIETGTHTENKPKKSVSYQSHHVLQGAATNSLIDYGKAICVLLANSFKDTAHQITTGRQNQRRDNKTSAKNFGELKKLSKEDLVESLTKGKNIPKADAEKLADCLVAEAEDEIKKSAKKNKDLDVDDSTPVDRIGTCFPAETLVWVSSHRKLKAGKVRSTQNVEGREKRLSVVRVDVCHNDILRIWIDGCEVAVAPFHRVRAADGRLVRADQLRQGEVVDTHYGPKPVRQIERDPVVHTLLALGVGEAFECRIGAIGLWAELPDTGVPVSHHQKLAGFAA